MRHDRFEIIRRVHVGFVATTYEARDWSHDPTEGKRVALRVVHPQLGPRQVPRGLARARMELNRSYAHRNILPILEVDEAEGRWFTMPWVDGKSVAEMLAEARRTGSAIPAPTSAAIAAQLLDLLVNLEDCAKSSPDRKLRGLGHGGLSPSSVMWTPGGAVHVTPLGEIVARMPDELTSIGIVDTGAGYRPRPVVQQRDWGHVDRYAVAAIAFEMAAGFPWHEVRDTSECNRSLARCGAEMARWLKMGLAEDAERGFSSAAEMRAALHVGGGDEPIGTI
jgi:serine/threonine protein kinase